MATTADGGGRESDEVRPGMIKLQSLLFSFAIYSLVKLSFHFKLRVAFSMRQGKQDHASSQCLEGVVGETIGRGNHEFILA